MQNGGKKQTHIVVRFLTTYAFLAASLIIIFSSFFYIFFLRISFQQIRYDAKETAIMAAAEIDGDILEQFTEPNHELLPEYQAMVQKLLRYHEYSSSVDSVYTLRPVGVNSALFEFVVDGMIEEDVNNDGVIDETEIPAHLGEEYDASCCPDLILALNEPGADRAITHDKWGHWISGYAPVYNSRGEAVAVLGVDISVDRFYEHRSIILGLLFGTVAVAIALSVLFGFWGYIIFRSESLAINRALELRAGELERKVREKTQAMRQFTAMLVHDLRAPLTAMKWSIQLLQEDNVSKEDRVEMYNDLASETQSLVKRVNEMLDVSKIDAGKFTVKTKKGDIAAIAREVVKDFTILAKKRGLELSLFAQEELPKTNIDAEKIQQVLQNLISNAIKYTESGSVHVAVLHEKSTKSLRVEVKDTGIGISPNDQKHLFIPFSASPTGESSGDKQLVSTGLGLAIVKGIIEAHGGKVGVISKKGKGTTFWFEVPLS